ncbi:hypothetical protein [Thorsellia kenyensis]|uniref:Uncharacterized protein n=1 Tax=Thorsellia kenyensis TaxID=1549888 RepID=A0ABV6C6J3_9GAMM
MRSSDAYESLVWGWGLNALSAVTQDSNYAVHEFIITDAEPEEILAEVESFVRCASN